MKKLLVLFMTCASFFAVNAQITTPQPSPFSKLEQKVGLTDVTLEYSRPGVKGRSVFGDLVPYGKMWRTGANKNSIITFSTDATIAGQTLKAGSYAIFTKPSKKSWEVYFYTDTENWGTPRNWDDAKVAARVKTNVEMGSSHIESFTIQVSDLSNTGATLEILWAKKYVAVPFTVPTDAAVSASINKVMTGPGAQDFYSAATYYLESGKNINKAVEWIDKAVDMTKDQPRFWMLRRQSLIHAEAGNKTGAIAAAKASLVHAEKAGNADYVKMNKDSLKEWGAM